jgi:hypothetical protein
LLAHASSRRSKSLRQEPLKSLGVSWSLLTLHTRNFQRFSSCSHGSYPPACRSYAVIVGIACQGKSQLIPVDLSGEIYRFTSSQQTADHCHCLWNDLAHLRGSRYAICDRRRVQHEQPACVAQGSSRSFGSFGGFLREDSKISLPSALMLHDLMRLLRSCLFAQFAPEFSQLGTERRCGS